MKQQTAVEWLIEELKGYEYDGNDFIFNGVITSELIEEVKAMEKEYVKKLEDKIELLEYELKEERNL